MYRIELTKGKRKWYWRLVSAANGKTIVSSQKYATKWSAKRSAWKLANENGYELRVV